MSSLSGEDEVILETPLSEGSKEGLAFSPYNPYQNVDEDDRSIDSGDNTDGSPSSDTSDKNEEGEVFIHMNGKEFRSMSKYQKYQRKKESEEEKRMFEEGYEYMDRLAAQQESQRFSPSIQELTDKKSYSVLHGTAQICLAFIGC